MEVAERIGSSAVALGLAASAHRFPMESTYRWDEEVRHAGEVLLQFTTTSEVAQSLSAHVLVNHPYELPHVLVYSVVDSLAGRSWVQDSVYVRSASGSRSRPCYVTIDVLNLTEQVKFWIALLGASGASVSLGSEGTYAVVRSQDVALRMLLQKISEPKSGKSRMHLDIECDDLQSEVRRACAAGAKVTGEFRENGFEWVMLADPEGNEFCLLEPRYPHLLRKVSPHLSCPESWLDLTDAACESD